MRNKKLTGIGLVIFSTLLNAVGQFFLKLGSSKLVFDISIIFNFQLFIGIFLYGISALCLITALKYGPLSELYPFISLTFIWVLLVSFFILKEQIFLKQVVGITSILAGVVFISKGGTI